VLHALPLFSPRSQEAWEAEGGGKFDRRAPKGESAKEFARSMLRKNPNAYFYRRVHRGCFALRASSPWLTLRPAPRRHNVPGEDMWLGEWSEEEVALFVKVRGSAAQCSVQHPKC